MVIDLTSRVKVKKRHQLALCNGYGWGLKRTGLILILSLLPAICFAANTSDSSDAFYQLFNKMQNLLQGGLGVSLSLSSFVLGVFGSAFSHRLTPATAGAGIALLVQYGPPIVVRLTGAVI